MSEEEAALQVGRAQVCEAMAMKVTYTNFGGQLVHENGGGVETSYVSDTLGSVVMCRDSSGNTTYEADYWPYGEVRTETGTNPSPWGFAGTFGYYTDEKGKSVYVRARTLLPNYARWANVDPLWPLATPYVYALASPTRYTDPSGLDIRICQRALRERDFRPCNWTNFKTPTHHWWIETDTVHCWKDRHGHWHSSVGYGPGGTLGHTGNLGWGYESDVTCVSVGASPAQEACICKNARAVYLGALMDGGTWYDTAWKGADPKSVPKGCDPLNRDYNFVNHNCQAFVEALFAKCGLKLPWSTESPLTANSEWWKLP